MRSRRRDTRKIVSVQMGNTFVTQGLNGKEISSSPVMDTITTGELEICFDENHGRPPYRVGGPFFHFRLLNQPADIVCSGRLYPTGALIRDRFTGYEGGFKLVNLPAVNLLGSEDISQPEDYRPTVNENDLSDLGTRGYNKLRPSAEVGSAMQAVLEARDLPRMLRTTSRGLHDAWKSIAKGQHSATQRVMSPKRAADHFINHEFGWRPFLSDLGNMISITSSFSDHVARIKRSNGRWQQRSFSEEPLTGSSVVYDASYSKGHALFKTLFSPNASSIALSNRLTIRRQSFSRTWYDGEFSYYYPEFDDGRSSGLPALDKVRQAMRLHGLTVSPTLIYKVTPWSWAVDWFANVGGTIQRYQDMLTDTVVAKYFYLMRESYDRYEYTATQTHSDGTTLNAVAYKEVRIKRRVSGMSAFGFSTGTSSLSGRQLAILAALGLSRTAA